MYSSSKTVIARVESMVESSNREPRMTWMEDGRWKCVGGTPPIAFPGQQAGGLVLLRAALFKHLLITERGKSQVSCTILSRIKPRPPFIQSLRWRKRMRARPVASASRTSTTARRRGGRGKDPAGTRGNQLLRR